MSMLNPTKWSLPVFGSNVTCVWKQAMIPFVEQRLSWYWAIRQMFGRQSSPNTDFINVRADAALNKPVQPMKWLPGLQKTSLNWIHRYQFCPKMSWRKTCGKWSVRWSSVRWSMTVKSLPQKSRQRENQFGKMGLEVTLRFNPFSTKGESSITSGLKNVETIKKDALIAKASRTQRREVEAEQDKLANDKRVSRSWNCANKRIKLKQEPC